MGDVRKSRFLSVAAVTALVAACATPEEAPAESKTVTPSETADTAAANAATDPTDPTDPMQPSGSTAGTDPGQSDIGDPHEEGAYTGTVRFIVLGDAGEGNDAQFEVADVIRHVCDDRGCDFALYLGDNFYDVGVTAVDDTQFQDKFEAPYADLDFPFYITLGNHDYGRFANEWMLSQYQIEYSEFSEKWVLPSEFYSFDAEHVTFISLDTSRLLYNHEPDAQREVVRDALDRSEGSRFRIAFAHHPYISNGQHGNAGNYDGLPIATLGGDYIKAFFDEELCGKLTVFFSGHDHNRQWHDPPEHCATHFIISGAGSKRTEFTHRDDNPPTRYEDDQTPGFGWVEVVDDTMTVAFYDMTGALNYEDQVTLSRPQ